MRVGSKNKGQYLPGSASGFSLMELLVVTAIIAVLAAILYPVLIKTKEGARVSECLSNMRQIGVGLHLYLDDNNGRFPAAVPYGSPDYWAKKDRKTIQTALARYLSQRAATQKLHGKTQYTDAGVFGCPSDAGAPRERCGVLGIEPGTPVWKSTGSSYEYYASNQDDWDHSDVTVPWTSLSPQIATAAGKQRVGATVSDIPILSKKAVLGDMFYWHMGDRTPDNHLAYCNTLFADGHAARVRGADHLNGRIEQLRPWHTATEVPNEK